MNAVKLQDRIESEILSVLEDMSKVKKPEEKLLYSKILKKLCYSLGVVFECQINDIDFEFDTDLDDEDLKSG